MVKPFSVISRLSALAGALFLTRAMHWRALRLRGSARHVGTERRREYRRGMLAALQRRELLRIAGQISDELGKPFSEAAKGTRIEGVLVRSVEMASGRHVLIERSRDFSLVPWWPVLDRQVGKPVGGIMREGGINWTLGRQRGGPTIS